MGDVWPYVATVTYAFASLMTGYSAWRLRRLRLAPFWLTWALVSAMSAVFAVAWGFVAFNPDLDRAVWSETITPASALFPIIFTLPAIVIVARMNPKKA